MAVLFLDSKPYQFVRDQETIVKENESIGLDGCPSHNEIISKFNAKVLQLSQLEEERLAAE